MYHFPPIYLLHPLSIPYLLDWPEGVNKMEGSFEQRFLIFTMFSSKKKLKQAADSFQTQRVKRT